MSTCRQALKTAMAVALCAVPTPTVASVGGRASSLTMRTFLLPNAHPPVAFASSPANARPARGQEPQHCKRAGMAAGMRTYQTLREFPNDLHGRGGGVSALRMVAGMGDTSKCPFTSTLSAGKDLVSVSCSSGVAVGAFLVVFWPFLLPLALYVNLRFAACAALAFLQLNLYVPKSTRLLALGVVGNALSLRVLRFFAVQQLTFFKNILGHPVSLALSFPPALLLSPVVKGVAKSLTMTGLLAPNATHGGGAAECANTDAAPVFSEGQIWRILDEVSVKTDATRADILAWTRVPNRAVMNRNAALAARIMAARIADARGVMEDTKQDAELAAKDLAARMVVAKGAVQDRMNDQRLQMQERMNDSRQDAQAAAVAMFARFDAFRSGLEKNPN
jgi:hypothetical protein